MDKVRDFYREQGFLDVEIGADKVHFEYPKPDRLVLTIDGTPALIHLEAGWERSYAELQAARVRSRAAVGA